MWHKWIQPKKKIEKWIDKKFHKFVAEENRNPHLSKEKWLHMYHYTEVHKFLFSTFSCELHEWFSKSEDSEPTWNHKDLIA